MNLKEKNMSESHQGITEKVEVKTETTLPRHWLGVEELNLDYWNDPKVKEKRSLLSPKVIGTIGNW